MNTLAGVPQIVAPRASAPRHHVRLAYRPEVDGLRAVAVLPVILFHAGVGAFSGGYVGVDVFFVISGYLITSIILNESLEKRFTVGAFYERRARRILPALFTLMVFCLPFAWWWMTPDELAAFGESLWGVALFIPNLVLWQDSGYFGGAAELKPLLHTWSLGIEEQYYLLVPLLVMVSLRFGFRVTMSAFAAIAVVSFAISVYLTTRQPMANFFLLPSRAWELMAGSLLAGTAVAGRLPRPGRWAREALSGTGLCLILLPVFLYDETTRFPGVTALIPVTGAALVIAFCGPGTLVTRLLTWPPVLGLGLISYSAYLWHQPLFAFARLMSPDEVPLRVYLALAAAAIACAWLSWRYVERPFRDRRKFTRRQIFGMGLAGSVFFVGAGAFLAETGGAPWRIEARHRSLVAPANNVIEGCPDAGGGVHQCTIGAPGTPTIAMVGDSHSYALVNALDTELKARGLAGIVVHTDCHPIPGIFDSREPDDQSYRAACETANAAMIERVTRPEISATLVAIRWTLRLVPERGAGGPSGYDNGEGGVEGDSPFRRNLTYDSGGTASDDVLGKARALRAYIERLAKRQKVVLIYPVPEVGWTPSRLNMIAVATGHDPPDIITTSHARYRERNAAAIAMLDSLESPNIARARPEELLCGRPVKDRCVVQKGGTLYYFDDDHLSAEGARLVVRQALAQLRRAVPASLRRSQASDRPN